MSTYLITGITGTLGKAVAKKLLDRGDSVVGLSRDEYKQQMMFKHENLKLVLGDIRDKDWFKYAHECTHIFHFAALKHVDVCGKFPMEAVKTNILGTENVCEYQRYSQVSEFTFPVSRIVLASTDKAFEPINQYGKTKAIAENLVMSYGQNVVCRYGNVFGSRGSVVHKFLESLRADKPVQFTIDSMTRFFMRQEDAANFVISCMDGSRGGIKIPELKSTNMWSLAKACATYLGMKDFAQESLGNRGAEKMDESMSEDVFHNSKYAPRFTMEELIEMIREVDV